MAKKDSPFETVIRILDGQEVHVGQPWFINKILSFNPMCAMMSIRLNEIMSGAHPDLVQKFFSCFPRKRSRYVRLNFARKRKEQEPKLVDKICRTFGVNKYHADQIIDLLRLEGHEPEKYFGLKKGE